MKQQVYHVYDSSGNKIKVEELLNGTKNMHGESSQVWNSRLSNEIGCLTQGNASGIEYQDCCELIHHYEVPEGKKVTYAYFIADSDHSKKNRIDYALLLEVID